MLIDGDFIHIHSSGIAHQSQDTAAMPFRNTYLQIQLLQLRRQLSDVLF